MKPTLATYDPSPTPPVMRVDATAVRAELDRLRAALGEIAGLVAALAGILDRVS